MACNTNHLGGRVWTTARIATLDTAYQAEGADASGVRDRVAYPIKRQPSAQITQASQGVDTRKAPALDPLENNIRKQRSFAGTHGERGKSILFGRSPFAR